MKNTNSNIFKYVFTTLKCIYSICVLWIIFYFADTWLKADNTWIKLPITPLTISFMVITAFTSYC